MHTAMLECVGWIKGMRGSTARTGATKPVCWNAMDESRECTVPVHGQEHPPPSVGMHRMYQGNARFQCRHRSTHHPPVESIGCIKGMHGTSAGTNAPTTLWRHAMDEPGEGAVPL